jgi:uncharacterized protein YyaL (SSP411 family)
MNKLKNEISPYLLQHANNPVNWYPWSKDAFAKAADENKPVFLSIGYSACHWCHVMERESFSNQKLADILNLYYVSIKVDREERPDIDKIYMDAVLAMTGAGGWPLNVFLTPDGMPFYGGTYFPPVRKYGMPSFAELLIAIHQSWENKNQELRQIGFSIKANLDEKSKQETESEKSFQSIIHSSFYWLTENINKGHGGWGTKPKFPHSLSIDFILKHNLLSRQINAPDIENTLNFMVAGGFYDLLRGGFHRYSTDEFWLVPHFEKMLYDNALLAQTYLFAAQFFRNSNFETIVHQVLKFVSRELQHELGGFYSSLDADSEDEEGLFYIWEYEELQNNIANPKDWEIFTGLLDVQPNGNFNSKIILRKNNTQTDLSLTDIKQVFATFRTIQDRKQRPSTDDKVLTDWNSLMLSAFSKAAFYFENETYKIIAGNTLQFIQEHLYKNGTLIHSWRNGNHKNEVFLSDYAFLINAILDYFLVDPTKKWLDFCQELTSQMLSNFYLEGNFYDTASNQHELMIRPKTIEDNVIPSGISSAVQALGRISFFYANEYYTEIALEIIKKYSNQISSYPLAFSNWLSVMEDFIHPSDYIVFIKTNTQQPSLDIQKTLIHDFSPYYLKIFLSEDNELLTLLPILQGKKAINGVSTVYICKNTTCSEPITSISKLKEYINNN